MTMTSTTISVVMPAYNAEKFIGESIESVINQTYQDWELIVVDDGSKDRTAEIAQGYADKDSRIKVFTKENGGISRALNYGLERAQSPWIARLDADDIALPERFAKQLAIAESNPDVVIWGSWVHQINVYGQRVGFIKFYPTTTQEFYEMRARGEPVRTVHPSVLFKKEVALAAGGYDPEMDGVEDSDLWARMYNTHGPMLNIPDYLTLYRVHPGSITAQKKFVQGEMARRHAYIGRRNRAWSQGQELTYADFCETYAKRSAWERYREYSRNLSHYYFRAFVGNMSEKNYLKAGRFFLQSAVVDPTYMAGRVKNRIQKQLNK